MAVSISQYQTHIIAHIEGHGGEVMVMADAFRIAPPAQRTDI